MRYWLVMPAAGAGRRFGTPLPKQYAALEGRTVIEWSLAPFLADRRCAEAVVALTPEDEHWPRIASRLPGAVRAVTGGAQRSHSVRQALGALGGRAAADDWVLVHDAVRPCLEQADLERLLAAAGTQAVAPSVAETVERVGLWRALTPQMFRYGPLCAALDAAHAAGRSPTDESQ